MKERRNSTGITAGIDPATMRASREAMETRRNRVTVFYVLLIMGLWATSFGLHAWTGSRISALEARGK